MQETMYVFPVLDGPQIIFIPLANVMVEEDLPLPVTVNLFIQNKFYPSFATAIE